MELTEREERKRAAHRNLYAPLQAEPIETAPFFASVTTLSQRAPTPLMVPMTGLMTDENLNVMRNDNSVIKGLYAVGNSLGGPGSTTATPICPSVCAPSGTASG